MDQQRPSSTGIPAPYGHACESCAQSKCKCIVRPDGGPCERCLRLRRECRSTQSLRRRNPKKSARTKRAGLEKKLDDLVSLIQSGGLVSSVAIPSQASSPTDNSSLYNKVQTADAISSRDQAETDSVGNLSHSDATGEPILAPSSADYTAVLHEVSPSMAEECLADFRNYRSKFFPFVFISSSMTAHQLWQERPFLWLCIMSVSSKSPSKQQALGAKVRQIVAKEMILQSSKSVDLLLGLLTFVGWANCQLKNRPFLSLFTQLAISLVFDMGLGKAVPKDTHLMLCGHTRISRPNTPRTMEERRAVLGCFLITSVITSFLQKTDALRWTPHMNECLQVLDARRECPNDETLIQQVRLQLIVEKLSLSISFDEAMESTISREPTSLYLEGLQSQLQSLKGRLLPEYQDNSIILLHLYTAEVETTLSPNFFATNLGTFQQKTLSKGLESVKSWFDVFFTLPPATYIGFPFSIFSQLLRCLMTLYRLKTLHEQDWNENGTWKTTDVLFILDKVISNMEQVTTLIGAQCDRPEEDMFTQTVRQLRTLRSAWETKIRPDDHLYSTFPTFENVEEISLTASLGMEFFDSDWLTDPLILET